METPLIPAVALVIAGIGTALFFDIAESASTLMFVTPATLCLGAILLKRGRAVTFFLFSIALFGFSVMNATNRIGRVEREAIEEFAQAQPHCSVYGKVGNLVRHSHGRWEWMLTDARCAGSHRTIELCRTCLRLTLPDSNSVQLNPGDWVLLTGGIMSSSREMRSSAAALTRELRVGSAGEVAVYAESVEIVDSSRWNIERWAYAVREWADRRLARALGPDGKALCSALLIGNQADFSPEFLDKLRISGLTHIFALSGMNVVVIAALIWLVIGLTGVPRLPRSFILLLGLIAYAMIGGMTPSLLRATLMACIVVMGSVLGRRTSIANVIFGAMFVELLFRPLDIVTPGFVLSYVAVAAIAVVYSASVKLAKEKLRGRIHPVAGYFGAILLATVCAQLGTIPFVAYWFGQVPLVGSLANLIAVPGFALLQIGGLLVLAVHGWAPLISAPISSSVDILSSALAGIVEIASRVPVASISLPDFGVLDFAFAVVAVVWLAIVLARRNGMGVLICIALAANWIAWRPIILPVDSAPSVTVIDVENGDAILLCTPSKTILVDTGPRFGEWSAAGRIMRVLQSHGRRSLDALVLTHPDNDHIGGAAQLLDRVAVDQMFVNGDSSISLSYDLLTLSMRDHSIVPRTLRSGDRIAVDERVHLSVLSPDEELALTHARPNFASIVLRLDVDSSSALLTGDIDSLVEHDLIAWGEQIDVDLLKVAHHGSKSSSCSAFLALCTPEIAVISAGENNVYGHPAIEAQRRVLDTGASMHCTIDEGTIEFRARDGGWEILESRAQRLYRLWHLGT